MTEDYKYNSDKKIKRSYLNSILMVNGRLNRMSKIGKRLNDDRLWEEDNHLYEEINEYEKDFNKIVRNESIEFNDKIHIEQNSYINNDCNYIDTNDICYCTKCVIQDKLLSMLDNQHRICTLNGECYIQLFECNKPCLIKCGNEYFNVVKDSNNGRVLKLPLTDFIDSIYC